MAFVDTARNASTFKGVTSVSVLTGTPSTRKQISVKVNTFVVRLFVCYQGKVGKILLLCKNLSMASLLNCFFLKTILSAIASVLTPLVKKK